jgi:flavin reductase (DIM6/NTAB) family NADH-FMN oxidoreductase RutF
MDEEIKREVLRMIHYGLYVLTVKKDEQIAAGTINWLSQASFKPPLVMVGVKVDSHIHDLIEKARVFAVNILGEDQKEVAARFFKPTNIERGKLNGMDYVLGETGCPLLVETPASFECRVVEIVKRGDHSVVIGEVVAAQLRKKGTEPLLMRKTGWFYGG